jgi:hypothetical protein
MSRTLNKALWAAEPEAGGWRRYLAADFFTAAPLEGNQLGVFPDGRGSASPARIRHEWCDLPRARAGGDDGAWHTTSGRR